MFLCMMTSGKPLSDKVREVLLLNACDMAEEGCKEQHIKGRGYEGFITSDLQSVSYVGMSIVIFEAEVTSEDTGCTKVRYGVRTSELDAEAYARSYWVGIPNANLN